VAVLSEVSDFFSPPLAALSFFDKSCVRMEARSPLALVSDLLALTNAVLALSDNPLAAPPRSDLLDLTSENVLFMDSIEEAPAAGSDFSNKTEDVELATEEWSAVTDVFLPTERRLSVVSILLASDKGPAPLTTRTSKI
jgi:hypothetical protein